MNISKAELDSLSVETILLEFKKGSRREYDTLVGVLSDSDVKETVVKKIMSQLKHHCSDLGKEHCQLISAALHLTWLNCGDQAVKDYQSFVVNLIASNPVHLRPCINMIVKLFLKENPNEKNNQGHWVQLHQLLNTIIKLVPMTPTVLLPILAETMPVIYRDVEEHACYTGNLFKLLQYLPQYRARILELIIDNITKLDVNAPKEDIQDEDNSDDEDIELFEMECEMKNMKAPMPHPHGHKLDVLMDMVFKYINCTCHTEDGKLNLDATKNLYREFLLVFDKLILPTHALNHVQFTMFYICSFHHLLVEGFIDYLLKKVTNPNIQPVFRQVSVAYVASLLARAKYISISTVISVLEIMSTWIHQYIRLCADSKSQPNTYHHGPFYSVCQSLFYIFIYRNSQLFESKAGVKCVKSINLQRIVACRLNPLHVCLPIIVQTFASIARQNQIAFCDTIMEKNRRVLLPRDSTDTTSQSNPLDSYFPFDPYVLKVSSSYISQFYQEYLGKPVEDDQESEMEDSCEKESSEVEENSTSLTKPATSPAVEFLLYGSSPGFNWNKHP